MGLDVEPTNRLGPCFTAPDGEIVEMGILVDPARLR
jgi:hypothetical protein